MFNALYISIGSVNGIGLYLLPYLVIGVSAKSCIGAPLVTYQMLVYFSSCYFVVAPYDVLITADFSGDIIARPAIVEYGDALILICTTFNDLDNTFLWFKDAVLIQGNTDIFGIAAVSAADGGLYECIVNNTAGNSTASITIYGKSYFT